MMVFFVVFIFHPVYSINCLPANEGKSFKDQARLSKISGGKKQKMKEYSPSAGVQGEPW